MKSLERFAELRARAESDALFRSRKEPIALRPGHTVQPDDAAKFVLSCLRRLERAAEDFADLATLERVLREGEGDAG